MSDKILDRIQKILDRANHPNTPQDERDAALAMADKLMAAHNIEEAAVRARNVARGASETKKHEVIDEEIDWIDYFDEFIDTHRRIAGLLASLAGVEIVFKYNKIHAVGYPDAIAYFKMLWVGVYLVFSSQLFPKWNRLASPGENIRTFAEAGYKWQYIWQQAVKEGQPFMRKVKGGGMEPVPAPLSERGDGGWMKREMAKAYAATGETKPELRHGVKNYRNSYAEGFHMALRERVWDMIETRRRLEREAEGGAQIMLARDVDAVKKRFNELFPPSTLSYSAGAAARGNHAGAAARGRTAASTADLTGGRGGVSGGARRSLG